MTYGNIAAYNLHGRASPGDGESVSAGFEMDGVVCSLCAATDLRGVWEWCGVKQW